MTDEDVGRRGESQGGSLPPASAPNPRRHYRLRHLWIRGERYQFGAKFYFSTEDAAAKMFAKLFEAAREQGRAVEVSNK